MHFSTLLGSKPGKARLASRSRATYATKTGPRHLLPKVQTHILLYSILPSSGYCIVSLCDTFTVWYESINPIYLLFFSSSVEQGFCSPPWIPYNGHCFHLHRAIQTWSDAQKECRKESGDLVSIRNVEDQSFVISQLGFGKWWQYTWRLSNLLFLLSTDKKKRSE